MIFSHNRLYIFYNPDSNIKHKLVVLRVKKLNKAKQIIQLRKNETIWTKDGFAPNIVKAIFCNDIGEKEEIT